MHSCVFQLSKEPIKKEDLADEWALPEWFDQYFDGYELYKYGSEEYKRALSWATGRPDGKWEFIEDKINKHFERMMKNAKMYAQRILDASFAEFKNTGADSASFNAYLLGEEINDHTGYWIYINDEFNDELLTFDEFCRYYLLDENKNASNQTFYVGSIWDYHN